ncbi:MAG: hypothetical protein ACD_34C00444G0001 [uncultured bacterium]|nr:MAG: hypothetical protein ACD_34C00444G0001 [uncultured bacterium]HCS38022.1 hypothetical protein [Anaerolineaceae bacterium]
MYDAFIDLFIEDLQNISYSITRNPIIPGVRCMLQAVSPKITSVGTIKFVNYYLFLDWENDLFGRLDALIAAHKSFREVVNEDFHVPHGWRMTLPNIVVAAISSNPFSPEAITFVQSKYQIPWQGGEVGQMMLFDLQAHKQYCHYKKAYKQTGSIPLGFAVDELFGIYKSIYSDARLLMHGEK